MFASQLIYLSREASGTDAQNMQVTLSNQRLKDENTSLKESLDALRDELEEERKEKERQKEQMQQLKEAMILEQEQATKQMSKQFDECTFPFLHFVLPYCSM